MNAESRWRLRSLCVAVCLAVAMTGPIRAQDDAEEPDVPKETDVQNEVTGMGDWYVGYEMWSAQPSGLGFIPATVEDPRNPFETETQPIAFDTKLRGRFRVGYRFKGGRGSVMLTWFGHQDTRFRYESAPGQFVFVAQGITPEFAGAFNDGHADGYGSQADSLLRDLRLDYYREAFRSTRIRGSWYVGYRRVVSRRSMTTHYFAMAPNITALLDPLADGRDDLIPLYDFVTTYSDVEARGAEAGFDVSIPLYKNDVFVDAGLGISVLRGRVSTEHLSLTYFYALTGTSEDDIVEILQPPYDEFNEYNVPGEPSSGAVVDDIRQFQVPISLNTVNDSTDSQVLETFLGLRWRAWRGLEVSLGFRNARYDNVGVEVYPREVDGTDLERKIYSVNYEGYYVGAAYIW